MHNGGARHGGALGDGDGGGGGDGGHSLGGYGGGGGGGGQCHCVLWGDGKRSLSAAMLLRGADRYVNKWWWIQRSG